MSRRAKIEILMNPLVERASRILRSTVQYVHTYHILITLVQKFYLVNTIVQSRATVDRQLGYRIESFQSLIYQND